VESEDFCINCGTVPHLLGYIDDGLYWVVQGVRNIGGRDRWYRSFRLTFNSILTRWYPAKEWAYI
jgi:hypothetical protein